jgi:hypothetical protein
MGCQVNIKSVCVFAGGWSFSQVDLTKIPEGYRIACNDAAYNLEQLGIKVDEVVSMDRLWSELRWEWMKERARETYLRDAACKNLSATGLEWCHIFRNQRGDNIAFAPGPQMLNGNHTGYCALNRVYQLKPQVAFLFGFDLALGPKGQRHWYGYQGVGPKDGSSSGYQLQHWANEMVRAKKEFDRVKVRVVNVSTRSIITAFEKLTPQQLGIAKASAA